jgi:hypothetical protein
MEKYRIKGYQLFKAKLEKPIADAPLLQRL